MRSPTRPHPHLPPPHISHITSLSPLWPSSLVSSLSWDISFNFSSAPQQPRSRCPGAPDPDRGPRSAATVRARRHDHQLHLPLPSPHARSRMSSSVLLPALAVLLLCCSPLALASVAETALSRVACGDDQVAVLDASDGLINLSVNGVLVQDRALACHKLLLYFGSGCLRCGELSDGWRGAVKQYCGEGSESSHGKSLIAWVIRYAYDLHLWNSGADLECRLFHGSVHSVMILQWEQSFLLIGFLSHVAASHQNVPRKLLRRPTENGSRNDSNPCGSLGLHENNQDNADSSENDDHHLAIPGVILLCCGLMLPCFHAERKEASRHDTATVQRNASELVIFVLL